MALNSIRNRLIGSNDDDEDNGGQLLAPKQQQPSRRSSSVSLSSDPAPISLSTLFIQSHDTLRGLEIEKASSSSNHVWNDRPPLLVGPKGQPESLTLLKGVSTTAVPYLLTTEAKVFAEGLLGIVLVRFALDSFDCLFL